VSTATTMMKKSLVFWFAKGTTNATMPRVAKMATDMTMRVWVLMSCSIGLDDWKVTS